MQQDHRRDGTRISKSSFPLEEVKKQDFKGLLWGPVVYEVLLKLYGQGLWPNGPIRGC